MKIKKYTKLKKYFPVVVLPVKNQQWFYHRKNASNMFEVNNELPEQCCFAFCIVSFEQFSRLIPVFMLLTVCVQMMAVVGSRDV